jgi:hypothetical protein
LLFLCIILCVLGKQTTESFLDAQHEEETEQPVVVLGEVQAEHAEPRTKEEGQLHSVLGDEV